MLDRYYRYKALRAMQSMHSLREAPDRGVTTVEYALILAAVVVAVSLVIFTFGDQIQQRFTDICGTLGGCGGSGG